MKHNSVNIALYLFILVNLSTIQIHAGETGADEQGFTANVTSNYFYSDNVTRSNQNAIDAYTFLLRPELNWQWNTGTSQFSVNLANETAKFEGSSEDNYSDNFFDFTAGISLSSRHQLELDAIYSDTHQERGEGFSIGNGQLQNRVDTFNQSGITIRYTYGREVAAARLGVYFEQQSIDFDARIDNLGQDVTLIRDRQDNRLGMTFSYEIGARTDLVLDLNQSEQDYDVETGLGNTVDALLVGVTWQATAKTSGRVLFGTQNRERTLGGSTDTGIWQVDMSWSPRTYSTVSLTSSKSSGASIGIGDARDITNTNIAWSHDWSAQWQSQVSVGLQKTDFSGSSISIERDTFGLDMIYALSDTMSLSLYYNGTTSDSNDINSQFAFDQTQYGIQFFLQYL